MKPLLYLTTGLLSALQFTFAGRHESLTARFAQGDKMQVVAATYFGGTNAEEFVSAGQLPDGTIVAFGNSTGPDFPTVPKPAVLGLGQHRKLNPFKATKGDNQEIDPANPDLAGMMVFYDERLTKVLRVVRFDWGVASLSLGEVSADGKALFVAGRCTETFRTLARTARSFKVEPLPPAEPAPPTGRRPRAPTTGPYSYQGVSCPGDVFVARLSPAGDKVEWVWIFEGLRTPPEKMWTDKQGNLYFDIRGLRRIAPDGQEAKLINPRTAGGPSQWLAVDPTDGGVLYGGDRNTHTGYQPYRQPYLYKFDQKGEKLWTLWEPNPKECACGGSGNGLCSDSSVLGVVFAPDGDLLVVGWSDGGNSVFTRQPTNWRDRAGSKSALGMEAWGMKNANSLAYLMRIDPKSFQQKVWTLWLCYLPDNFVDPKSKGAPNFASIRDICGLPDGSLGFAGLAATGLIQTPGAFWKDPGQGEKYGGEFIAAITEPMTDLLFSSYLPGCRNVSVKSVSRGMVAVSASTGMDKATPPTPSPLVKPVQPKLQGPLDAHIILLDLPAKK